LTNLKKNKRVNFGENSPEPEENEGSPIPKERINEHGAHSGLVKIPNVKEGES
jgi:hypothetical protein